jgi:hypothetical protein
MPKECLKINFRNYFYKVYSLILKGIILKALILFDLMQIKPIWQMHKYCLITILDMESCLSLF